jgi:hypothetical protein
MTTKKEDKTCWYVLIFVILAFGALLALQQDTIRVQQMKITALRQSISEQAIQDLSPQFDVINARLDAIDNKLTIMANYTDYHRPFTTGDKEK